MFPFIPARRSYLFGVFASILILVSLLGERLPHSAQAQGTSTVYLPLVSKNYQTGPAIIQGVVFDAIIGKDTGSLPGAQVCIQNTTNCDITEADGSYFLDGFNNGLQTLVVTKDGFSTLTREVTAQLYTGSPDTITVVDLPLSKNDLGNKQYRVVLTWDSSRPVDLDANLWVPPLPPDHNDKYQIANSAGDGRGNCSAYPDACIDIDSLDGSAPESITINEAYDGTYIYAVRHYDFATGQHEGKPPLDETGAHVDVYDENGLIASFNVPSSNDDLAIWWHVFDLDGTTGTITPVNEINSVDPGSG